MRRKSVVHNKADLHIWDDLNDYLSEKTYKSSLEFWEKKDCLKKIRRHFLLKGCKNLFAKRVKSRFLMTNLLLFRLCVFSLKNKKSLSVFRKYVLNYDMYILSASNFLRSSNLMMGKSLFYNFLNEKNFFYAWYNTFSKRNFFLKKFSYKQPSIVLKKGSDLFILGFHNVSDQNTSNLFVCKDYNCIFTDYLSEDFNLYIFFDVVIQQCVEIYKITQLLYFYNLNK